MLCLYQEIPTFQEITQNIYTLQDYIFFKQTQTKEKCEKSMSHNPSSRNENMTPMFSKIRPPRLVDQTLFTPFFFSFGSGEPLLPVVDSLAGAKRPFTLTESYRGVGKHCAGASERLRSIIRTSLVTNGGNERRSAVNKWKMKRPAGLAGIIYSPFQKPSSCFA